MKKKRETKEKMHPCDCTKPELRNSFKEGRCSDAQIAKYHGMDYLNRLKLKGLE